MMFVWQKLTDARGVKRRPCGLRTAMKSSGLARTEIVIPGETARFVPAVLFMGLGFMISMVMGFAAVDAVRGNGFQILLAGPFLLVLGSVGSMYAVFMGYFLHQFNWRNAPCATRALTRSGLCASCGQSMEGCPTETDDCTVCPECGAAWRMGS